MNKSRRDAVKTMLGGLAAVPVMNLVATAVAYAQDLPEVTADDPTAVALRYSADATAVDRTTGPGLPRTGLPPAEQFCHNCQFSQAYPEEGWEACTLFPGKKVNTNGWCASWTLKAAG
jgi:hypothetical protein